MCLSVSPSQPSLSETISLASKAHKAISQVIRKKPGRKKREVEGKPWRVAVTLGFIHQQHWCWQRCRTCGGNGETKEGSEGKCPSEVAMSVSKQPERFAQCIVGKGNGEVVTVAAVQPETLQNAETCTVWGWSEPVDLPEVSSCCKDAFFKTYFYQPKGAFSTDVLDVETALKCCKKVFVITHKAILTAINERNSSKF